MHAPDISIPPTDRRAVVRRRLFISALLPALPMVLLAGAWPAAGVSGFGDDTLYYFPMRAFVARWWSEGVWPSWNPLSAMGTSVVADPQAGLFYPGTWLFACMPAIWAYPVTQVLHFALAGAGMYRWLRAERMRWPAALLGAIAFEFGASLIAHRAHLTIHHAVAWLPWIFYAWTRYADTGTFRYITLAVMTFGLHMLVQHMQVTIMLCVLLSMYIAFVLWPRRRAIAWVFPLAMVLGVMISGVQTWPAYMQFAGSTRQVAAYYVFIENPWLPTSAIMLLFPMFFGNTTFTFYGQTWWGLSHFCEQYVYATILVFILAGTSIALLRCADGRWNRRVLFWWIVSILALLVALGDFTPMSKWLFHVPVYRNLRVPARWLLVWSVAFPMLAAMTMHALLAGGEATRLIVSRAVRAMVVGVMPALALLFLATILVARVNVDWLEHHFGDLWSANVFFDGLRRAAKPTNPALWIPLLLMVATGAMLLGWLKSRRAVWAYGLALVWLVDLISVVSVADVNSGWMTARDLREPPLLARKLRALDPHETGRLLVPRFYFEGHRPLDTLSPSTNVIFNVPTFNSYGPLWPQANRLIFRMAPWGASESIVELLRNTRLMRMMGVRFVAVRSDEERMLFHRATVRAVVQPRFEMIAASREMTAIPWKEGVFWPVRIDEAGLYRLSFRAARRGDSASRWFVTLEDNEGCALDRTRSLDPVDLSAGSRELHFLFMVDRAVGEARVRVKSEMGVALSAGRAEFGRVGDTIAGDSARRREDARRLGYRLVADLKTLSGEVITLYELEGAVEPVYFAEGCDQVASLGEVVDALTMPEDTGKPARVAIGADAALREVAEGATGEVLSWERPRPGEVRVQVQCPKTGLLVFNETADPGWRAWIDGRPAEILTVNGVVQGICVPEGSREVRWRYQAVGAGPGAWMTGGGLLLLGAWGGIRLSRKGHK